VCFGGVCEDGGGAMDDGDDGIVGLYRGVGDYVAQKQIISALHRLYFCILFSVSLLVIVSLFISFFSSPSFFSHLQLSTLFIWFSLVFITFIIVPWCCY